MKKWIKYVVLAVLVALGAFIFYKKVYIPKATYEFVKAKKGDLNLEVFGIGNVWAKEIYPVTSQVAGKITYLSVDQGDWVKKGDLIAKIDPVDLPDLLEEAKIAKKKAALEIEALQKELRGLIAKEKFAEITYDRYAKLKNRGFAAQVEYDRAKSDLESLKASIDSLKTKILSAKEEVKRAKKNIEALEKKLSRFEIYSPIDGYVVSKDAQLAQTINPSQPIVTVVDPKTVWIRAYIDEKISGGVEKNKRAQIILRSKPNEKLRGFVARIESKSDPVTEERVVDVAFDKIPIPFYLNEQAEVYIKIGKLKDVIKIPGKVLVKRKGKIGVWAAENGKAFFKEVKVLGRNEGFVAVSGIKEGEIVLVPNPKKKPLFNGASIRL